MSKDDKGQSDAMNSVSEPSAAGGGRVRRLDKSAQTAIGTRLRAYYDEVAREEIPDRFVELLKQLEKKDVGDKS